MIWSTSHKFDQFDPPRSKVMKAICEALFLNNPTLAQAFKVKLNFAASSDQSREMEYSERTSYNTISKQTPNPLASTEC